MSPLRPKPPGAHCRPSSSSQVIEANEKSGMSRLRALMEDDAGERREAFQALLKGGGGDGGGQTGRGTDEGGGLRR